MIRQFLKSIANRWPFPVKSKLKNGWGIFVDLRSGVSRGIYVQGEFDPQVFDAISGVLEPGSVFLDIGANVGVYSIQALSIVGETGEVHAFEIDPRPLRCLNRSKKRFGYSNLKIHAVAVGSSCGSVQLNKDEECGNSQVSLASGGARVPMTTLDSWAAGQHLRRLDVIKIDVEGFEMEVLKGGTALLAKHRPKLIVEADDKLLARNMASVVELKEYLQSLNYLVLPVEGTWSPTIIATPKVE